MRGCLLPAESGETGDFVVTRKRLHMERFIYFDFKLWL